MTARELIFRLKDHPPGAVPMLCVEGRDPVPLDRVEAGVSIPESKAGDLIDRFVPVVRLVAALVEDE